MSAYDDEPPRPAADDLRRVARYQRWIVAVVLAQLGLWAGYLLLAMNRGNGFSDGREFLLALTIILGCAGGIYAFLIYWSVRDPFWAVVMGLAAIPPGLGLLALTVVNGTATRTLEAGGVTVGLFGADIAGIEDDTEYYDEDAGW